MMRVVFFAAGAALATATVTACALISGLSSLEIVDDAGADRSDAADASDDGRRDDAEASVVDAAMEAGADAPPNRCPAGRGPSMVEIIAIDGRSFCIDSTEVTQAQYQQFLLATAGDASDQRATCTWNTTYAPGSGCAPGVFQPDTHGNKPVVCIDWCDAAAFCAWAGKRMCGQIGGGSLPSFFEGVFDPAMSQWHAACSRNGARVYPYGDTYAPASCNGVDRDAQTTVPVGSLDCAGGFDGIRDMSGNAMELEDACDESDAGPKNGVCHARGGSFGDDANWLRCDSSGVFLVLKRSDVSDAIGVRCCAD
jgi:formylglycine-generating enzyme required for sulfatase activity